MRYGILRKAALLIALAAGVSWTPAAEALPLSDLVRNLSQSLHRGSWFRDRSDYYQRFYMERFKGRSAEAAGNVPFYRRLSVALVSPTPKGEVIARLVYDTDGNLKPKEVRPNSRNVFGAPGFLELVFFPLYPELVSCYEIMDLGASSVNGRETRMLRLLPLPGAVKKPLVEGVFHVEPDTGRPVRLSVTRLHNFEALDSKLKKLFEFKCELDFRTLPNEVSVPWRCKGSGYSEIMRWNGYFTFTFNEWEYRPCSLPQYADVKSWFEKLQGFGDPAPPDTPLPADRLPEVTETEPTTPTETDLSDGSDK